MSDIYEWLNGEGGNRGPDWTEDRPERNLVLLLAGQSNAVWTPRKSKGYRRHVRRMKAVTAAAARPAGPAQPSQAG